MFATAAPATTPDAARSHWRLFGLLLNGRRWQVAALALLIAGSSVLPLAGPQILRRFIDLAAAGEPISTLAVLAGAYVALALVSQAVRVTATYAATRVAWTATNQLRGTLARHLLRLDLAFHGRHPPGELIERADGDVTALSTFLSSFVPTVAGGILTLIGVLVAVALEDWRIAVALALFAAVVGVTVARQRDAAVGTAAAHRAAIAGLFGEIEERLAGAEDLRANAGAPHAVRRFHHAAADAAITGARSERTTVRMYIVNTAVFVVGGALSLGVGVAMYRAGALTLGTVFLLFQYTELLRRPIDEIVDELERVQEAAAGITRIDRLMATAPSVADRGGRRLAGGPLAVELDGVAFAYDDGVPVIGGLSLRLRPGAVLGVVGRSGSGKTTIARLLLRLIDPVAGAVRVGRAPGDVTDLREVRLDDVRTRVGLVTQDVQLFAATVRDNLTLFGAHPASDERLVEVVERLGLGGWLRGLPSGLDSMLGACGAGSSAGEAQLLAFARVFLRDPGLVILDEAASRVDPVSEARIEHAVDLLLRGRTAVMIAHRLGTVGRADDILVLDHGVAVEHGPREALAADPGSRFAALLAAGRDNSADPGEELAWPVDNSLAPLDNGVRSPHPGRGARDGRRGAATCLEEAG
jgi:ABC-type multidrug transport system fused ATPase/permease subunit